MIKTMSVANIQKRQMFQLSGCTIASKSMQSLCYDSCKDKNELDEKLHNEQSKST